MKNTFKLALIIVCVQFFLLQQACKKSDPNVKPEELIVPEKLPEPSGAIIYVENVQELNDAVERANQEGQLTVLFKDGTYYLDNMIYITADNISFRSESENRDAVILKGNGMDGNISHVFLIAAKHFTIGNLTLGWVANHGIQVQGENDADNFLAHNVRFVDTREQMLKVSYKQGDATSSDNSVVQYCLFEFPDGKAAQYYTGGIDAHQAHNWLVRGNVFKNIKSPDNDLAEHAIHFWSNSSNSIIENNKIVNCDRGIGFGLGDRGHKGGIIRNNMVFTTRDVGIGLENAENTYVYNNTVYIENYSNAIEYRFANTNAVIKNNLCNMQIAQRNDATAELSNNCTCAESSWFVEYDTGDLHLTQNIQQVIDKAVGLEEVKKDFDGEERPKGAAPDIGADETLMGS